MNFFFKTLAWIIIICFVLTIGTCAFLISQEMKREKKMKEFIEFMTNSDE